MPTTPRFIKETSYRASMSNNINQLAYTSCKILKRSPEFALLKLDRSSTVRFIYTIIQNDFHRFLKHFHFPLLYNKVEINHIIMNRYL